MPPLRPLPSQPLRPAWSACNILPGTATGAPSIPRRPSIHHGRSFATSPDDPSDKGKGDGDVQVKDIKRYADSGEEGAHKIAAFRAGRKNNYAGRNAPPSEDGSGPAIRYQLTGNKLRYHISQVQQKPEPVQQERTNQEGPVKRGEIMDDATWQKLKQNRTLSSRALSESQPPGSVQDGKKGAEWEGASTQQVQAMDDRDKRLMELETLLAQARKQLAELQAESKKERSEREGQNEEAGARNEKAILKEPKPKVPRPELKVEKHPPQSQAVEKRGNQTKAKELEREPTSEIERGDTGAPVRYLSKYPGRPLPHTTDQVIPKSLLGSRTFPPKMQQDTQAGDKQSLLEELFPGESKTEAKEEPVQQIPDVIQAEALVKEAPVIRKESIRTPDSESTKAEPIIGEEPTEQKTSNLGKSEFGGPLLPELFPELALKETPEAKEVQEERVVPRLTLEPEQSVRPVKNLRRSRADRITERMAAEATEQIAVICLHGASPHLTEEDFRRLVPPSSKHIEGWTNRGDFIKVIPVRDEVTLERQDRYWILFETIEAARQYQSYVHKCHLLVRQHAPSSITSALPHPPDPHGLLDIQDVDAALRAFTLGAFAKEIHLKILPQPYAPRFRRFIQAGGYEPIVSPPTTTGQGVSGSKVLFRVEGAQPSIYDIRRVLQRHGKDRGIPWGLVGGVDSPAAIRKLNFAAAADQHLDGDEERTMRRRLAPRYVVAFESDQEARRFVRFWHRRPFEWSRSGVYENGEGAPVGCAEVLW